MVSKRHESEYLDDRQLLQAAILEENDTMQLQVRETDNSIRITAYDEEFVVDMYKSISRLKKSVINEEVISLQPLMWIKLHKKSF